MGLWHLIETAVARHLGRHTCHILPTLLHLPWWLLCAHRTGMPAHPSCVQVQVCLLITVVWLCRYACSSRAIAVPSAVLNARRLANMIKQPFISVVSQQIMDFKNHSNMFVESYPELTGIRWVGGMGGGSSFQGSGGWGGGHRL